MGRNALVGTGGPAPCRAALPERSILGILASKCFNVHIYRLSSDDGKHPAYQLELNRIHYTSMSFALLSLSLVIGAELWVMTYGTACTFCQYALYLGMTGV